MKIAVTYDDGKVFQHFGHTEQFKLYTVEEGQIRSSELISSNGAGHGALASLLAEHNIDVLICGGIGGGAQAALAQQGITLCAGASGDADEAVAAYLRGELVNTGANCSHHGEGHACGHHDGGHCGHHEDGHCGGHGEEGCPSQGTDCGKPLLKGKNAGKICKVHYRGSLNDGTQFDSSYDRGEPLEFLCGVGMMIPGFDAAAAEMEPGEIRHIHLRPEEAYGQPDPEAVFTLLLSQIPGAEQARVGQRVYLQDTQGNPFPVLVTAKDDTSITFDANHELAGKELNFTIELLEVRG